MMGSRRHVQLQGQIAVLPAHLLAAPLDMDGDAALSVGHNNDEHDHNQCQNHRQGHATEGKTKKAPPRVEASVA